MRIDKVLATLLPNISRKKIQTDLKNGNILIENKIWLPKKKIFPQNNNNILNIRIQKNTKSSKDMRQLIPINILFEDENILVINKSSGLVVHPGSGNENGTLLNGLLYYLPILSKLPRAGIIHRLDKNTTGVMIVAKNIKIQNHLSLMLKKRNISRLYIAICCGNIPFGGTITTQIGRHPKNRIKMAVIDDPDKGKKAITHFNIIKRYNLYTYIQVKLETGRTHQIRVHLSHIGYPIVGDTLYGASYLYKKKKKNIKSSLFLNMFKRQALHAFELSFFYPFTYHKVKFIAPLPNDMKQLFSIISK